MTIDRDLDVAIDEELIKRANGKRPKPWSLLMGTSALRALAAVNGNRNGPDGFASHYRDVPICRVAAFEGWVLRA